MWELKKKLGLVISVVLCDLSFSQNQALLMTSTLEFLKIK